MSVIQSNTRQWSESKWYYELKMQNEMKLTDESWISYQQGKGNEEYQKYMEDLTDMQNHVLPYLQRVLGLSTLPLFT